MSFKRLIVFLFPVLAICTALIFYLQRSDLEKSNDGAGSPAIIETLSSQLHKLHCSGLSSAGYAKSCGDLIDKASVTKYADHASREGGKLTLKLASGESAILESVYFREFIKDLPAEAQSKLSITEDPNAVIDFFLYHYFDSQKLFLLNILYWEGSGFLMLDRVSGEQHSILDEPAFDSSGDRFVAASLDLEASYNPNAVEVWERKNGSWVKTFTGEFKDFGVQAPRWVENNKVILDKYILDNGNVKFAGPVSLFFQNDKWEIAQ